MSSNLHYKHFNQSEKFKIMSKIKFLISLFLMLTISNLFSQNINKDLNVQRTIDIKANTLLLIGIINPAIEIQLHKKGSLQLECMGIFYPKGFPFSNGRPLSIVAGWLEYRQYFNDNIKGFFVGANGGVAMYRMCKTYEYYINDNLSIGSAKIFGAVFGYKMAINKRLFIEASWSPGWQESVYEGYQLSTGEKKVSLNRSGEWLAAYKGGLYLAYRF
jgi:hypothetical protein